MMESVIIEKLLHIDDRVDIDMSNLTPIQEFYKDTKILVTGFTGFLGQLLVEKLLRSCPVSTIYVLMRQKKRKDIYTRLQEIFNDHMFTRMKKVCPGFLEKIVVVEGDCSLPDLGISDQQKKLLIDEVNIVFHLAGAMRFDEKLKIAVPINIRATRDLSLLARRMPYLKSFVYVSTAYTNCVQEVIDEKIFPTNIDYQQMIIMSETVDSILLESIAEEFKGKYPNTYTYTKQIAENVLKVEMQGLPSGIYRPSIVLSTFKEPVRGWCNNVYGATGVFHAAFLGVLRVLRCDKDIHANIVPADMCVNGLIAVAWEVGRKYQETKHEGGKFEMPVYNYENSNDKPITWKNFQLLSSKYAVLVPSVNSIWSYYLILIKSYSMNIILTFLLHMVPAYIADSVMFLRGKKIRFADTYRKIHHFSRVLSYFILRPMKFRSINIRKMLNAMSSKDRELFFCDLRQLDWDEFFVTYGAGIRVYLGKDPMETVEQGKQLWKRFRLATKLILTIVGLLGCATLWPIVSALYKSFLL